MIARHQHEHEAINAREYPGTRQLCSRCEQPTGRCEEDSLHSSDSGPLCESCYYPEDEEPWEKLWLETGGIDIDGSMWLTPRMERNAVQIQ